MAQQAIDSIGADRARQEASRVAPTLGMRGGLGKTLLVAFLLLAILPLSLLALLTYHQIQRGTSQKLLASLETVVALKESHLLDWVKSHENQLSLLASVLDSVGPTDQLTVVQAADPVLDALLLFDLSTGDVLASTDPVWAEESSALGIPSEFLQPMTAGDRRLIIAPPLAGSDQPLLAVRHAWDERLLIGLLNWDSLRRIVTAYDESSEDRHTSLVTEDGWILSAKGLTFRFTEDGENVSSGAAEILAGQNGSGAYNNRQDVPVFGAYRWIPDLQIGILTEQSQHQALASGNALTAMLVGATLAVALITSALAAVVTRRVTRPIVKLTETAAYMARGDLDQKVAIARKDEIGILARAFNRMAAELRVLYGDLEEKVAERTRQLEEANSQTSYYLMQLATSAEVARVVTSIRDLDRLLPTVVGLIGRAFEFRRASIYLLDGDGSPKDRWALVANWQSQGNESALQLLPEHVEAEEVTLVGQVAADGCRRVVRADDSFETRIKADAVETAHLSVACEMAVPLRVQERILGVLDLQSSRPTDFGKDEELVYQSLADQISIAIENARAYAAERETVKRLRELDRIQSEFLTNMSHALRTPLNSIIGFSRVLLKELDGPVNETQRADLDAIYDSGRQLLGLINDMLDLSHLELGVTAFSPGEVDLAEIIEGVMTTARALARGKSIHLHEEVPESLPTLHTDGQRVRQVILALLANAVKFTDQGSVCLRVSCDDGHVTVSVEDTGMGISRQERERVFTDAARISGLAGPDDQGIHGFDLAISKRVVEKLGGRIWMESVEGVGSTFTFTLPVDFPDTKSG